MGADKRFEFLLKQYLNNEIDLAHQDEFFHLIENQSNADFLSKQIQDDLLEDDGPDAVVLPPYLAEEIIRKIVKSEPEINGLISKPKRNTHLLRKIAIAAALIGVTFSVSLFLSSEKQHATNFSAIIPKNIEYKINKTNEIQILVLSDGTKVYLNPGSTLHYNRHFNGDSREVYLDGEAFFNVKKNPNKPFLVYYNNIITKVLGTSFRLAKNKSNGHLIVEVKTGKVQVSENAKMLASDAAITPIILTPNQKVTYDKSFRRFDATIVGHPVQVLTNEESPVLESHPLFFDQQKLNHVFGQLEKFYQIEISVENSATYNCVFSGDISNLDLFSALKIICIATNAEYEINGTKILIKGKGCI